MSKSAVKTLRVVLEVKVRGDATEQDLKWAVMQRLRGKLSVTVDHYLADQGNSVGRLECKLGERVFAAVRVEARSEVYKMIGPYRPG